MLRLGFSAVALAVVVSVGQADAAVTARELNERIAKLDRALHEGDYRAAEKEAARLFEAFPDVMRESSGTALWLARLGVLRAIANEGLGRSLDAEWYWDVAANLFPDVLIANLDRYGSTAAAMRQRMLDREPLAVEPRALPGLVPPGLVPPKVLKRARVEYPEAASFRGSEGTCVVRAVIRRDGRVARPVLLTEGVDPRLAFAVLDSLRRWKFRPAQLDGEPTEVRYQLEVDFLIRR